jgi:hypothetical protein
MLNDERANSAGGRTKASLPAQQFLHSTRLPFTDDELLLVRERQKPALAAQRRHLRDMIEIDEGVAVDSRKIEIAQLLLNLLERLRCQVSLLPRNDPDQLPFGLEGQNLGAVQQVEFFAEFSDDLSWPRGRSMVGDLLKPGHALSYCERIPPQLPNPFDALDQPLLSDRFQQIVDRPGLKSLNRMLIEGGDDDNARRISAGEVPHNLEAIHYRHLKIQEHQLRHQAVNALERLLAIFSFTDDLDVREFLELFSQDLARYRLIVHDQRPDVRGSHPGLTFLFSTLFAHRLRDRNRRRVPEGERLFRRNKRDNQARAADVLQPAKKLTRLPPALLSIDNAASAP